VNESEVPSPRAATLGRWAFPIVWLTLPFTMGPALADALRTTEPSFRTACSLGAWIIWAAVLGAALVPRTVTLTAVRIVAPATVPAAIWATVATSHRGAAEVVALSAAVVVTLVALAAPTGAAFVNGSAYGLELRLPLRPPGALLLGPIELAWALTVAGATVGPLLLADHVWILGAGLLLVGWPLAAAASRSLHILSRRWLVFTPAGVVLHDQLVLLESLLVVRQSLRSIGPARVGTPARDLSLGAPGLLLELSFTEPLPVTVPPRRRRAAEPVASEDLDAVLFAPTRPGRVLAEATARRLPVLR
jgi:hypothetical protein